MTVGELQISTLQKSGLKLLQCIILHSNLPIYH
jgi:hypothetical protein